MALSIQDACGILAVSEEDDRTVIKKAYRKLMHLVHPDALAGRESEYRFSAQELNAAYEILLEHISYKEKTDSPADSGHNNGYDKPRQSKGKNWTAPINPYAFTERNIYVDHINVAQGKYYLSEDEEFRMFLLSIYNCSRKVLAPFPDVLMGRYLGELAYLLSQQFVNRADILGRYEIEQENGTKLYYFPAMLETEGKRCALKQGTVLAPLGVRNHRLYVKSMSGDEKGYISFSDDRIYYALIPLFELRMAEVKIRVSGSVTGNNNVRAVKVRTLDLWVRTRECNWNALEVSISDRIRMILNKLRSEAG